MSLCARTIKRVYAITFVPVFLATISSLGAITEKEIPTAFELADSQLV